MRICVVIGQAVVILTCIVVARVSVGIAVCKVAVFVNAVIALIAVIVCRAVFSLCRLSGRVGFLPVQIRIVFLSIVVLRFRPLVFIRSVVAVRMVL